MNSYDDRELARELQALAVQIPVPQSSLPARRGSPLGRGLTLAGAAAVVLVAIVVGAAINNLRAERENSGAGTTPTPSAASASPSPSAALAFPNYSLIAGTSSWFSCCIL